MKSLFIQREFPYDGTQLRSLFGYLDHGVQGDSVVSWIGPCSISFDHMVDGEDLLEQSPIEGARMVHFIIEKFHTPLVAGVALQRLFASIALDYLRTRVGAQVASEMSRSGDDLYLRDGKLSISIATVSPMSTLIHFAVNTTNDGTPVKTACLADLGVDPAEFAREVCARFVSEMSSIEEACVKVKWVQ